MSCRYNFMGKLDYNGHVWYVYRHFIDTGSFIVLPSEIKADEATSYHYQSFTKTQILRAMYGGDLCD